TCLAETGNDVICVDTDEKKIERLKQGNCIIYEPGLESMMIRNMEEERLQFSVDLPMAVRRSLFNFIAVGTPPGEDGSADLSHVLDVATAVGRSMDSYKIIIDKSTVPVGTAELVGQTIRKETNIEFDVVSNPEFLKEGAAVNDFMKPNRVIIGTDNVRVAELMKELYRPFVRTGNPIIIMNIKSAELTKYAANAMLATRISFMNEMANLCELVGADIDMVRQGISTDTRIGSSFLFPGVGYGGSCFPKDVKAIIKTSESTGYAMEVLKSVENVNNEQKKRLGKKISSFFKSRGDSLKDKKIGIWGLSFKPQTDDMREAPSIVTINQLLAEGAKIIAYDPAAMDVAKGIFKESIRYGKNTYDCLSDTDALIILTEWNEFRRPNFDRIKNLMKEPVIFDGRNIYEPNVMKEKGFSYYCIGR
ncbi:MAG: UDP-glucose dehydrogenase family protein, partial [bacterium]